MPCIALIVSGELEKVALPAALTRAFPEATFVAQRVSSFTSSPVSAAPAASVPALVDKFAAALVAAVDPGRSGQAADMAIAIEDLELANIFQPDAVCSIFAGAVARHVASHWPSEERRARARRRLSERASFHLLSPMPEAYFFSDPACLAAAGTGASPLLQSGTDLEYFMVRDPTYLAAGPGRSWARRSGREHHPKAYLQYLLDPTEATRYRETRQGKDALGVLDLHAVVSQNSAHTRFLRSLLADIALFLDRPPPSGDLHPTTAATPTVLRNC